ncbi:3,4-dihydroxy-2-butanone-4-phosphate synthase [Candidatus Micrarchaeota archaeon]|nr:3,4-dihydroxy-2-butanone-4-phosphate synthase [Candidatus Micrarchaeota archaeon]MBU1166010.1 3,4-dihydroxy-2-butanone-4-phosphate synthase [Candidatus Micrarchaeota archaeon]MBU1886930.1 3,4-dihydroxy-2-butanone-4-phosphate synthase [Candidatus Micrarchaeota archaeon]
MQNDKIQNAIEKLKKAYACVIYDGNDREGEADLIIHAKYITPEWIERLRKNAGGLICLAIEPEIAKKMGLVFYTDILASSNFELKQMECKKTAYNDKPSFSIPVNHKEVYTGITDTDRALTIKKLAELAERAYKNEQTGTIQTGKGNLKGESIKQEFMRSFYSPGHVFLLIGRGIENRKGHTELALELARRAGMQGTMVLCEMLAPGRALSKKKAKMYAEKYGYPFLEGSDF